MTAPTEPAEPITAGAVMDACARGKDLALLLGGGGLAGLAILGAGDLASYVFSSAPAALLPLFVVVVLITALLIGTSYSGFDNQAAAVQRSLDAGTLASDSPVPDLRRFRRARRLRHASLIALLLSSLVLVTACVFVWLG